MHAATPACAGVVLLRSGDQPFFGGGGGERGTTITRGG
jgi:hypothetical protein